MQENDPTADADGGGGDEIDEVAVDLVEDGFEVRFTTPDGAVRTAVFPYPEGAYPCAGKGGADRAWARTEAGSSLQVPVTSSVFRSGTRKEAPERASHLDFDLVRKGGFEPPRP